MKSILAILALGLMLAAVFSGCVGGENTNGTDTTMGTDTTGDIGTNETGNETGNQTATNTTVKYTDADLVVIYHDEKSGSLITFAQGVADVPVPVKSNAKKIVMSLTSTGTPGVFGGVYATVTNANGDTAGEFYSGGVGPTGIMGYPEAQLELKEKEIKKGGFGDWNVQLASQVADVQTTYTFIVDVYGIV